MVTHGVLVYDVTVCIQYSPLIIIIIVCFMTFSHLTGSQSCFTTFVKPKWKISDHIQYDHYDD